MSRLRLIRWVGPVERWNKLWRSTAVIPAITHRNSLKPSRATAMGVLPGSMVTGSSKVRRRNLLIEWMVLLIQNTRADASRRKMSAQEKIPAALCQAANVDRLKI